MNAILDQWMSQGDCENQVFQSGIDWEGLVGILIILGELGVF